MSLDGRKEKEFRGTSRERRLESFFYEECSSSRMLCVRSGPTEVIESGHENNRGTDSG